MISETCTLNCNNGGYCSFHTHDGTRASSIERLSSSIDQLCVCPHGWAGFSCLEPSTSLNPCHKSDGYHVCRSGGLCHRVESFMNIDKEEEWKCDCELADHVNTFAGAMCREPAIEYCDSDRSSFCTNGGTCISNLINFSDTSKMSGNCICPPDFTGPHCEFLSLLFGMGQYPRVDGKHSLPRSNVSFNSTFFLFLSVLALVSVISLVTWRKTRASWRGRNYSYSRPIRDPDMLDDHVDAVEDTNGGGFVLYDVPLT